MWKIDEAIRDFPIHKKQHGFQSNKGTESALSNTVNYIERYIFKKESVLGVFLDISSAFDTIDPTHVKTQLLKHGGDVDMVEWYFNYLLHRDIEIELHNETVTYSTGMGFPQGGVCSAKLWLVAFDPAIEIINKYGIEGNGFADDCSALIGGSNMDKAINKMQLMLDELTEMGDSCSLKFNPTKTVALIFSRKQVTSLNNLSINGDKIAYSENAVSYTHLTLPTNREV